MRTGSILSWRRHVVPGGCKLDGAGGTITEQTPSYNIYNVASDTVSRTAILPSTILTDAFPNALYPILYVLPTTGSLLVRPALVSTASPVEAWALSFNQVSHSCDHVYPLRQGLG